MGSPVGAHRAAAGLTADSASFNLDIGFLHDIRPLACFGGEEGAELLGRGDVRLDAELARFCFVSGERRPATTAPLSLSMISAACRRGPGCPSRTTIPSRDSHLRSWGGRPADTRFGAGRGRPARLACPPACAAAATPWRR